MMQTKTEFYESVMRLKASSVLNYNFGQKRLRIT